MTDKEKIQDWVLDFGDIPLPEIADRRIKKLLYSAVSDIEFILEKVLDEIKDK
jgi:hypothetical protein